MGDNALEKYKGCLLGGAVGDALGAPIEFHSLAEIRREYGPQGLDHFVEGEDLQTGLFTDDTQMTLFTAEGLLRAHHRGVLRGIGGAENAILYQSYLRWLHTQGYRPASLPQGWGVFDVEHGRLMQQSGLFARRGPGNTCLNALRSGKAGEVGAPINNSKGCGGIMRAAPVGLFYHGDSRLAFERACQAAAITHGHPSGYLSAGCLAAIIAGILRGQSLTEAIGTTVEILRGWEGHEECLKAIEQALALQRSARPSADNINKLGEGWTGEETLAIALFCALHFQTDFHGGVVAAVNINGDKDSTGAVTGNILGALLGKAAIPAGWLENLQMADLVEEMAGDLFIQVKGDSFNEDAEWAEKYPPY